MKIMLACNAGMSTSLVVNRMKEAATEEGKEYKIWAVEQGEVQSELGNFDVLLLGPQIRHIQKRINKLVGDRAKVAVIDSQAYGMCDGKKVLAQAEALMKGD